MMTSHETLRMDHDRSSSQAQHSWISDAIYKMASCQPKAGTFSSIYQAHKLNDAPDFFRVSNSDISEITLPPSLRHIPIEFDIIVKLKEVDHQDDVEELEGAHQESNVSYSDFLSKYFQHLMAPKPEEENPSIEDISTNSILASPSNASLHGMETNGFQRVPDESAVKHVDGQNLAVDVSRIESQKSNNDKEEQRVQIKPETKEPRHAVILEGRVTKPEPSNVVDTVETKTISSSVHHDVTDATEDDSRSHELEGHEIIDIHYVSTSLTDEDDTTTAGSSVDRQDPAKEGSCEVFDSEYQSDDDRKRKSRFFLPLPLLSSRKRREMNHVVEGVIDTDAESATDDDDNGDAPIEELQHSRRRIRIRPLKVFSRVLKRLKKRKGVAEKVQLAVDGESSDQAEWEIISCTATLHMLEI